jgi:large-conductance mechanosensitive channel
MTAHIAVIATAFGTIITALGGFIVSITVLMPLLKTAKGTHKIVNQDHTNIVNYNRALVRALKTAGVEVPVDQSFPEVTDG